MGLSSQVNHQIGLFHEIANDVGVGHITIPEFKTGRLHKLPGEVCLLTGIR